MIEKALQSRGRRGCVRMLFVELDFPQPVALKDEVTRLTQDILNQAERAIAGQAVRREHPMLGPGQQVVCHIGEQDQGLLGGQRSLAPLFEMKAGFVGPDLHFAQGPVVVVWHDLLGRPGCDRAQDDGVLQRLLVSPPAQDVGGHGPAVGERLGQSGPLAAYAEIMPAVRRDAGGEGGGPAATLVLAQHLPVVGQHLIEVGIAAEARITADDDTLALGGTEA